MTYILQIKIAPVYFRSATSGQAYQFTLKSNTDFKCNDNIFGGIIFFFIIINVYWAHENHPSLDEITCLKVF